MNKCKKKKQTQLKSGYASKVSASSKKSLIAVLQRKVQSDIFIFILLDQHFPCSSVRRFSPATTPFMSISCTVSIPVTFSAQFPSAFYLGQQLGHLFMHKAIKSKILLSVHQAFCPFHFLRTHSTPDL